MPRAKGGVRESLKKKKNLMITPLAEKILINRAKELNLSMSEYMERFARNELPDVLLLPNKDDKEILGELLGMSLPSDGS